MSNATTTSNFSFLSAWDVPSDLWKPSLVMLAAATIVFIARPSKLNVPTVGPRGLFSSWRNGVKSVKAARALIQEGYEKYGGAIFKLPTLDRPVLIVSSSEQIEEMRKAPANVLSFAGATQDTLQTEFMFGSKLLEESRFHVTIIRTVMSRHLPVVFPEILEELSMAFQQHIPEGDGWVKVPAFDTVMQVVARATSRLFVGVPLCRDPGYLDLSVIKCTFIPAHIKSDSAHNKSIARGKYRIYF